ncbi:MAG TPA: CARDB domain-containing protein [Conexibacter sp.]|nr:CARDB domain-containing protein [Conexibacter sp.]
MVARLATALIAAALVAPSALAAASERGAGVASGAPVGARLLSCHRSPLLAARVAVVGTWMRPVAAGRRPAVRVDLWQRLTGGRWTQRTDVPGLGVWIAPSDPQLGSRPGDVFKYRQSVGRLAVPASYRFRVGFRWENAAGAVVRTATVTTAACREPDVRPDLVLDGVQASPSPRGDGLVRYDVTVRNAGRSPSPRAVVAATLPGDASPNARERGVPRLLPGERTVVAFTGPGCAAGGQPASFAADPSNAIDEANEANNELVASCPAP